MTREEVIKKLNCAKIAVKNDFDEYEEEIIDFFIVKKIINEIFDDFESKMCKNCKYFKGTGMIANCSNLEVGKMNGGAFIDVDENFGCNKFERRGR